MIDRLDYEWELGTKVYNGSIYELSNKINELVEAVNEINDLEGWLNKWGRTIDVRITALEEPDKEETDKLIKEYNCKDTEGWRRQQIEAQFGFTPRWTAEQNYAIQAERERIVRELQSVRGKDHPITVMAIRIVRGDD